MMMPKEYYPTPYAIVEKMLTKVDMKRVRTALEPSAGMGNIVEKLSRAMSKHYNSDNIEIHCVESDENFRAILSEKFKDTRIVGNDFLAYNTLYCYDLIIMNPPFSNGDKHLLKALNMLKNGGQCVCLLNAETIRNPYSNARKELVELLTGYNADIEYLGDVFSNSERKTDVEVAMIYVNIPKSDESDILKNLKLADDFVENSSPEDTALSTDMFEFMKAIVEQYQREVTGGMKFLDEYRNTVGKYLNSFDDSIYNHPVITVSIDKMVYGVDDNSVFRNKYIKSLRYKYWKALFERKEFSDIMTEKMKNDFQKKLNDLVNYEFNLSNIKQLQLEMSQHLVSGVEESILALFDDFSRKYAYSHDFDNNVIHYYNGWNTNKVGIINKKVVIRLNAYDTWHGYRPSWYETVAKISDIYRVFSYLDGSAEIESGYIRSVLEAAEKSEQTKNINFGYFTLDFFKKGTCHIKFKDMDLLKRFNIFAGKRVGGLPPVYGKKAYSEMNERERAIIDEFEGENEYKKSVKKGLFADKMSLLMIETA